MENGEYEGPLKLHLPVNMELDPDGAFSFDAPLPSPTGKIGEVRPSDPVVYECLAWMRRGVWRCAPPGACMQA